MLSGPLPPDISKYGMRKPEEHQRLVDQVGAQVVQHTAGRKRLVTPGTAPRTGGKAVEMSFIFQDFSQVTIVNHLLNGLEIAIPATVLENEDLSSRFFSNSDQLIGFRRGGVKGFSTTICLPDFNKSFAWSK